MLVYANHTPEAVEGLPPFATIVAEAFAFHSVTTFWAWDPAGTSTDPRNNRARSHVDFMMVLLGVQLNRRGRRVRTHLSANARTGAGSGVCSPHNTVGLGTPAQGPPNHDVTNLLVEWSRGDKAAFDRLLPLVYGQLRSIAARHFRRERPGHALQPTALVHEAYLKLIDQRRADWKNRAQFFGVAAQVMRRILIDHARAQRTAKRGAGETVSLDTAKEIARAPIPDVLALDDALARLAALDPRQAQLVELRCFGGLTIEEAAHVIGISETTVKQEWR